MKINHLAGAAALFASLITLQPTLASAACGKASWYGPNFHGRQTASGERFNQMSMTAAHRSMPLGSRVVVSDPASGRSVTVRINDRGPYAHGRIIDLSKGAADVLGIRQRGVAKVCIVLLR
jgi:rare lipoprotein A